LNSSCHEYVADDAKEMNFRGREAVCLLLAHQSIRPYRMKVTFGQESK
jgi:hypothetical protein